MIEVGNAIAAKLWPVIDILVERPYQDAITGEAWRARVVTSGDIFSGVGHDAWSAISACLQDMDDARTGKRPRQALP